MCFWCANKRKSIQIQFKPMTVLAVLTQGRYLTDLMKYCFIPKLWFSEANHKSNMICHIVNIVFEVS